MGRRERERGRGQGAEDRLLRGGEQASQGLLKVEEERWPVKIHKETTRAAGQGEACSSGEQEEAQCGVRRAPSPGFLGQRQVPT